LFSEEVAEANPTLKTVGGGRGERGEYTAIMGEPISIAVNVIVTIIPDSGRGEELKSLYLLKIMPPFKES